MESRISNLQIMRKRHRILHQDPFVRRLQAQYDVQNNGEVPEEELFFILEDPLPGLRVTTGSGEEVSYLSPEMVEEKVGDPQGFIQEAMHETGDSASAHLLWIRLEEPLEPGGFVVLRFDHRDVVSPPYSRGLVQEPKFQVREEKAHEGHDTLIEIHGPDAGKITILDEEGTDETWRHDRFFQTKARAGRGQVGFEYKIQPRRSERWLIRLFYGSLTVLPILMFLAGFTFPVEPIRFGGMELRSPNQDLSGLVGVVGITGTLALLGFARPPWVQRLYFLIPLFLYFSLLIWRFPA